jgi:hypothetical protein
MPDTLQHAILSRRQRTAPTLRCAAGLERLALHDVPNGQALRWRRFKAGGTHSHFGPAPRDALSALLFQSLKALSTGIAAPSRAAAGAAGCMSVSSLAIDMGRTSDARRWPLPPPSEFRSGWRH